MNKKDLRGGYCEMQHRHFRTIAAIIRNLYELNYRNRRAVANKFAIELEKTNPNFNSERFIAACLNGKDDDEC